MKTLKALLFILMVLVPIGARAVTLSSQINSNVSHELPTGANSFTGLSSAIGAVTNQWCGDQYYATDTGQQFLYQCKTPVPNGTPAAGNGCWVPFAFLGTPTNTWTSTATWTITPSFTPTPSSTNSPTPTPSNTPTKTWTGSLTPSNTPTITNTPSNSPTNTPTVTPTNTGTNTPTFQPTLTPIIGEDVLIVGRSLESDSGALTANGNILYGTYNSAYGYINPGDIVAVTSCTTTGANRFWPVVNSTSSTYMLQTNIPVITIGSGKGLFVFDGQRVKNTNLFFSMSGSGGNYLVNLVNIQPDKLIPTNAGTFYNTIDGVEGYIDMSYDNQTTSTLRLLCVDDTFGSVAQLDIPASYFSFSFHIVQ